MRGAAAATMIFALAVPALAQQPVCLPPAEPFIPVDDGTFGEYADLVAEDFERYFSEFGPYIACLDAARQAAFVRARGISAEHQAFWNRADRMGLTEEVGTDAAPE